MERTMNLGEPREKDKDSAGHFLRLLCLCALFAGFGLLILLIGFDLTWPQQAVMAVVAVLVAMWMDRASSSYLATLTLVFISTCATFRYGYWRISATVQYFHNPEILAGAGLVNWGGWLQGILIVALLLAEGYAAITLVLGYMQTLWPLRRMPVALPEDPAHWPAVDLLIPTYNEPLSIVRSTALAAVNIDWPAEKLNVYILDDGGREDFRKFAEEAGIGYIARDSKDYAKAGNLNDALRQTSSPFIAVFDSDHVPTRSFLQLTTGWFLHDERLGMLQTPQLLYSPDPFDRNLDQFRTIPNEGELFYGIVQDGNDFWNSTLFCGSCAVLRRSALKEVGGIASETFTEDVHTSLRMQMSGWNTAYINIPQAAGLATESLDDHIRQRIRWARGMVQILRIENPLFAKGLGLAQRLCYFNAMSHFLYALPRLIFLLAPLAYLVIGTTILPGPWAAVAAFALPHLLLSSIVNSRIQGQYRHPFWNEIYETILAPYLLFPTLFALLRPTAGDFDVTPKGSVLSRTYFDGKTAIPFLGLMLLQAAGLVFGMVRTLHLSVPFLPWLQPANDIGSVVMNMLWAGFNLVILGVCTAVAWESHQRRATVRLTMAVPVDVLFLDGTLEEGLTADISNSGVALRIHESLNVRQGEQVQLIFPALDGEMTLPATVVELADGVMRAHFDSLTLQEEEALTLLLYSRADTWLGWSGDREADRPWKSMRRILMLALGGLWHTMTEGWEVLLPGNARFAANAAHMLLLAGVFMGLTAAAAGFRSSRLHAIQVASVSQAAATSSGKKPSAAEPPITPDRDSDVEIEVPKPQEQSALQSADDLARLPLPFFDAAQKKRGSIPIVFLSAPSHDALKAAGIVASAFGIAADREAMRFPVSFGTIPRGNAIVILENAGDFQPLDMPQGTRAAVSIRRNPQDITSKVLVISGGNGDEAVKAASGLAFHLGTLQGDHVDFSNFIAPKDNALDNSKEEASALPDLELFARYGLPFTRQKDLSGTVVVLPENPTPEDIELYLTFMGQFGESTGHPTFNVTVTNAEALKTDSTKDFLVLNTGHDQAAMRLLNSVLPVVVDETFHLQNEGGFFARARHDWWRTGVWRQDDARKFAASNGTISGIIEGAAWPGGSKRSVVVIALCDPSATDKFLTAYLDASRFASATNGVGQSVTAFQQGRFTSYRIGIDSYRIGQLPLWLRVKLIMTDLPWIIVLLNFAISFVLAVLVRTMLRQKARQRLLISV
jgi:cellulose synthase catalytic subunit (UDP-forming)